MRRSGEYDRALHHFEAAIALYRTHCLDHPNMARALVNAAYVKRLITLELQPRHGQARCAVHAKLLATAREALELLPQAEAIYAASQHEGGLGSKLVNAAHIHLECGDIDRAATEAERALAIGEAAQDSILMARALSALSAVDLARGEEQLGGEHQVAIHANRAAERAGAAVTIAQ